MKNFTLEQEFEVYKDIHIRSILISNYVQYYYDLINSGVVLSGNKSPEDRATDFVNYLETKPVALKLTYDVAWDRVKHILP